MLLTGKVIFILELVTARSTTFCDKETLGELQVWNGLYFQSDCLTLQICDVLRAISLFADAQTKIKMRDCRNDVNMHR